MGLLHDEYICPICSAPLENRAEFLKDKNGHCYPIKADIPRFVESSGYTDNFSLQWNKFPKTQLDNDNQRQSSKRFWNETAWLPQDLDGIKMLEVGSGAGRFSRVVLEESCAELSSVDYSEAVAANASSHRIYLSEGRLKLAQASVYALPYSNDKFDRIFCMGVLQHTPDFRESLRCLIEKLKPGGHLVVDFYPINGWWTKVNAKYLLRPLLKGLPPEKLMKLVEMSVPISLALYKSLSAIGLNKLTRFLPICDINGTLPAQLNKDQLTEWCVLDTFDMYSPAYDNPQRIRTVASWMDELGAEVSFAGFVSVGGANKAAVVRAIKRGAHVLG